MKCINYRVCGHQAASGHAMCNDCRRMAERGTEDERNKQTLTQLERKPRNVADVFGTRRGK